MRRKIKSQCWHVEAPGGQVPGLQKNVQQASLTFPYFINLLHPACQVFSLEFQKHILQIGEHFNKNVSLQRIVILAGRQL